VAQVLVHPELESRVRAALRLEMPHWWRAGEFDMYLLRGVNEYGIGSAEVRPCVCACLRALGVAESARGSGSSSCRTRGAPCTWISAALRRPSR
jgi:hypothetical protein